MSIVFKTFNDKSIDHRQKNQHYQIGLTMKVKIEVKSFKHSRQEFKGQTSKKGQDYSLKLNFMIAKLQINIKD